MPVLKHRSEPYNQKSLEDYVQLALWGVGEISAMIHCTLGIVFVSGGGIRKFGREGIFHVNPIIYMYKLLKTYLGIK